MAWSGMINRVAREGEAGRLWGGGEVRSTAEAG